MPLTRQLVPIVFGQGVDTQTDPKQLDAGKLTVLENAHLERPRVIRKRSGYDRLPTPIVGSSSILTTGRLAATLKDELFLSDGARGYALSRLGCVDKGVCEALSVRTRPVTRNAYQQSTPDCAIHSQGISLFTWEDSSGGSRYSVHDTATGQPIVSNAQLGTNASRPKPFVLGNFIVIVYFEVATGRLCYCGIPVLSPQIPTGPHELALNVHASQAFDAGAVGGRIYVAYLNTNASADKISIVYILPGLTNSVETLVADTIASSVAVFGDAQNRVWIAYAAPGDELRACVHDYSLAAQVLAPTLLTTVAGIRNVGGVVLEDTATVVFDVTAAQAYNAVTRVGTVQVDGTVTGFGVLRRSVGLASKPFVANGLVHVVVAHQSVLQPTYFVLQASGAVVAKIAPSVGGGLTAKTLLPEVVNAGGLYSFAFLQADRLSSVGGTIVTQSGVMQAQLDFAAEQSAVELSDNLHITGGILSMFDGVALVEHGFHLHPEHITATPNGAGGLLEAGQRQYVVVWEWMDNFGCIHRSAPSVPVTVTTAGATSSVELVIPTLRLTAKATPISAVVYRTQANQVVFYRVTSISSPVLNNPAVDTVSFTDIVADTAIGGNEMLYTTGGEVENIAAPAPLTMVNHQGRIILVPAENRLSWWYSKKVIQGTPVEFHDAFVQTMDLRGGDIVAVHPLDEKIIFFKRAAIFAVTGDGPSPNGLANDYSDPNYIPSDCGCIAPRSVVLTPHGLLFQGEKGIHLLDRTLAVSFVGQDVKAFTDGATVTSAELVADKREVRFTLSTGVALCLAYEKGQWHVARGIPAIDACKFQNRFTYLTSSGQVHQEKPGSFVDAGSLVRLKLTTGWLSFGGIQGFQRIYKLFVLGEYRSPHKLQVSVAYDMNPAVVQQIVVDAGELLGQAPAYGEDVYGAGTPFGGEFPLYQFRFDLEQQKCSSIQVTIEEMQNAPFGEGLGLSALSFEVGVRGGPVRARAARTVG